MEKPISTSIYTFEDLIGNGCMYVDKTRYFYQLVKTPKGQFFCARPRRFGKSLAISILEAIFRGRRDLFEGLWIHDAEYDWQAYPVVHIDFARANIETTSLLKTWLAQTLRKIALEYDVVTHNDDPALLFGELIEALHDRYNRGVVILIDEYDRPVLEHLERKDDAAGENDAEAFQMILEGFYQMVKGCEPFLRFAFITGVTRFAKLSVFSKLNSLDDISMSRTYAEMFGYTQTELESYFGGRIDDIARSGMKSWEGQVLDRAGLISEIAHWYDGFRFAEDAESVYNPVSVGKFFNCDGVFENYWFDTGTPTFLMRLIRDNGLTLVDVADATMSIGSFGTFDLSELSDDIVNDQRIVQLLYQTGYLTLGERIPRVPGGLYKMRYPNQEVQLSFEQNLFSA